jgi:hypothetical protein
MISETIERFRYRFELWRREQREDLSGEPRTDPRSLREYRRDNRAKESSERWSARLGDPKWELLLTESMWRSVVRAIGVYLGVVLIAALLCRLLVACLPTAQFTSFILFLVLVSLWTLLTIPGEIDFYRARRNFRDGVIKSSNQALEPTAGRRDAHI